MGRKKKSKVGIGFYFFLGIIIGSGLIYAKENVDFSKFIGKFKKSNSAVSQKSVEEKADSASSQEIPQQVQYQQSEVQTQPVNQNVAPPIKEASLYTVQVASFKDYDQAKSFVGKLNNQELNAFIAPSDEKLKSGWYRIFVGEYMNKLDAQNKSEALKDQFKDCFIRRL